MIRPILPARAPTPSRMAVNGPSTALKAVPPGASLAVSRDRYEFNPAARGWRLNKEVLLDLDVVLLRLAPPLRESYRRVLQFYAQNYSPAYCAVIHQGVHKLLRDMGADGFSQSVIEVYRAKLGVSHEWRLGSIRGFLLQWHAQGYPGVSDETVDFLSSITLKGNEKGAAVRGMDPHDGPFDDQELEAILIAVAQHYDRGDIALDILSFTLLLVHTGRRPGQLAMLRAGDLHRASTSDGRRVGLVRIPRSKQRGRAPRTLFKDFCVSDDTYRVLRAQRDAVIAHAEELLATVPNTLRSELPLFPNWPALQEIRSTKALEEALGNDGLHAKLAAVRAGLDKVRVYSVRTGCRLHLTPRRFRYTLGSRAAREGYGAAVIAELLDHTDLQNVTVYCRDHPNFRQKIDRAVGQQLVPLAHAFAGLLVDSEADAQYGHDPAMRVGTRDSKVGTCGSAGFCGAHARACYTCVHFQPWRDAPHAKMLGWLLAERQRAVDAGASESVVAAIDRSIQAVRAVIAACAERKAEIERIAS